MGGKPPAGGEEPQEHDHGTADDGFASVVFDEAFVRAAEIHEPSADEREAAARSWAEAETRPWEDAVLFGEIPDDGRSPHGDAHDRYGDADLFRQGPHADGLGLYPYHTVGPYRSHVRWQRPVAWVLAVVMGVGVVAMAFSAVYRGAVSQRQAPTPPPATSDVERQPTTREAPPP